ncbi:PIN domain nuclease [Bacillus sp. V3-13]|uniref:PIN domain-containing protein n=1 Tax=Bacillus sp. V3-13 TaxID=2053728 RepID=UPI000C756072|nr:PIN domain-containing protein [Bacillus sp. V3-13]PLR79406.1 PIN domain nuclease [Bacillus sp. V3-13]
MYLLDTNIIVRFLTNDDEKQSPAAYSLFEKAVNGKITLLLEPLVIAECCRVLESKRYSYAKKDIADKLSQLISAPSVKMNNEAIVQKALSDFSEFGVDFVDAYMAAYVYFSSGINAVITWNEKDFKKINAEFLTPDMIITVDDEA